MERKTVGGPTILQNLTDSPDNQHAVVLVLQNVKPKISGKPDRTEVATGWKQFQSAKHSQPAKFGGSPAKHGKSVATLVFV